MSNDTHCAKEDLHKRSNRQIEGDGEAPAYDAGADGEEPAEVGEPKVGDEPEVVSNEMSDGVSNKICQMTLIVQTKLFEGGKQWIRKELEARGVVACRCSLLINRIS